MTIATRTRWLVALSLVAGSYGLASTQIVGIAQARGFQTTISVDDPRPLAKAAQSLERRFGWVITYEDPRAVYQSDVADVTATVRRDHDPTKSKVLIPRGGPFSFAFNDPGSDPLEMAAQEPAVLNALLSQYRSTGYPGEFRVMRAGAVFHVVPTGARDASGTRRAFSAPLDSRISVPASERTAFGMIREIVQQVNASRQDRLVIGTVPTNLLNQTHVNIGDNNETARQLLLRTLQLTERTLSWRVLCDPGEGADCVLNIHPVTKPGT